MIRRCDAFCGHFMELKTAAAENKPDAASFVSRVSLTGLAPPAWKAAPPNSVPRHQALWSQQPENHKGGAAGKECWLLRPGGAFRELQDFVQVNGARGTVAGMEARPHTHGMPPLPDWPHPESWRCPVGVRLPDPGQLRDFKSP